MRFVRSITAFLLMFASTDATTARLAAQPTRSVTIIKFGKLVDGTGRVIQNARVAVENDRVQNVTSGDAPVPDGAEVIDLSRFTGIPGLMLIRSRMVRHDRARRDRQAAHHAGRVHADRRRNRSRGSPCRSIVEIGSAASVAIGDIATIFDARDGSRPEDMAIASNASVYDLTMHLHADLPRHVL